MNVLSLFDGIACGRVALERSGIPVENYFASEIKKIAIKCAKENHKDITHIGDVRKVKYDDGILFYGDGEKIKINIDLVIAGSPCQNFSRAMKSDKRTGLCGEKSGLFYEFLRILNEVNPKFFLFENVKMKKDQEKKISEMLGVLPININSSYFSAALRRRYYWTNIKVEPFFDKKIKLQDILTSGTTDREKARCLLVSDSRPLRDEEKMKKRYKNGFTTIIFEKNGARYMNKRERERCQTLPDGYTDCLTENEAADVLGDGWTVDVIAHIFKGIKGE